MFNENKPVICYSKHNLLDLQTVFFFTCLPRLGDTKYLEKVQPKLLFILQSVFPCSLLPESQKKQQYGEWEQQDRPNYNQE